MVLKLYMVLCLSLCCMLCSLHFQSLLPSLSGLQEISVEECTWLQSGGVAAIAKNCPDLKKVNLRGKG